MARCRSCSAEIMWGRTTPGGKRIPVDVDEVDDGNIVIDGIDRGTTLFKVVSPGEGRYVSHFVTCPNADEWRAKR